MLSVRVKLDFPVFAGWLWNKDHRKFHRMGWQKMVESLIGGPRIDDGLSRQNRLTQLRRRIAAIPARGEEPGILPVPAGIGGVLPRGGLPWGAVVSVDGAASLLVGLVASVSESGGHVAVVGQPRLGVLAAYEMGAQLERVAFIPAPGPDPVEVAAVLLDGMDLVILGLAGASVPPSRARAIVARARSKGSTLVVTEGHWEGPEIRLDARVDGYNGFGQGRALGHGRLESLRLSVRVRGRSFRSRMTRLDICSAAGRVEWQSVASADVGRAAAL